MTKKTPPAPASRLPERESVAWLVHRAGALLTEQARDLERDLATEGLRPAQVRLLRLLDFEGVRMTVLAQKLGISKQAVGQLVQELVRSGRVRKLADPRDGRVRRVALAVLGAGSSASPVAAMDLMQDGLEECLGAERLGHLLGELRALVDALGG